MYSSSSPGENESPYRNNGSASMAPEHGPFRYQWIVPRRIMCGLFWAGVLLIFVGMILLVITNPQKGQSDRAVLQSWGAVVLGLGLCVMLSCIILCIHTYFVMSRRNRERQQNNKAYATQVHLSNATVCTTLVPGAPSDCLNGSNLGGGGTQLIQPPRLVRPPHYGMNVVTNAPPLVQLYVKDDEYDKQPPDGGNQRLEKPQIVIIEPEDSPVSGIGQTAQRNRSGSICDQSEVNCAGHSGGSASDLVCPRRMSASDRKLSGSSGVTFAPANEQGSAAEAWLTEQQTKRQSYVDGGEATIIAPLPFPPAYITFDATADDDYMNDALTGAAGGGSSCDESFSQSTETIIARDNSRTSTTGRRKSVYYNIDPSSQLEEHILSNSELDIRPPVITGGGVTLPRARRQRQRSDHVNFSTSSTTNISTGKATSGKQRKSSTTAAATASDVVGGQSTTTTAESVRLVRPDQRNSRARPLNSSAQCRVTRVNLHSVNNENDCVITSVAPMSTAVTKATKTDASTAVSKHYQHHRNQHQQHSHRNNSATCEPATRAADTAGFFSPEPPSLVSSGQRFPSNYNNIGNAACRSPPMSTGEVFSSLGTTMTSRVHYGGLSSDPRSPPTAGTLPATISRTYGPACVTVTPLVQPIVSVEPCPKFPSTLMMASSNGRRGPCNPCNPDSIDDSESMRPLDAGDLLRSEYEMSFGGQVNPLLLYNSVVEADDDVNLSKRTVYDNIQYFKV